MTAKKEKEEKQAIRDHLYAELASDKDFIARDEQEKRLHRLEDKHNRLLGERDVLMESVDKAKAQVNRLLRVPDVDACMEAYSVQLGELKRAADIGAFKDTLQQVISYKNQMSGKVYKRRAELDIEIRELSGKKKEWDLKIENLKNAGPQDFVRDAGNHG